MQGIYTLVPTSHLEFCTHRTQKLLQVKNLLLSFKQTRRPRHTTPKNALHTMMFQAPLALLALVGGAFAAPSPQKGTAATQVEKRDSSSGSATFYETGLGACGWNNGSKCWPGSCDVSRTQSRR